MSNPLEPLTEAERAECLRLANDYEVYASIVDRDFIRDEDAADFAESVLVARALRIAAAEPDDDWGIGKTCRTASDAPDWLPRCRRCGIPRGTVAHGAHCMTGNCDDPDASRPVVADGMRLRAVAVAAARHAQRTSIDDAMDRQAP